MHNQGLNMGPYACWSSSLPLSHVLQWLHCFKKGTHEIQRLDYLFKFTSWKCGCEHSLNNVEVGMWFDCTVLVPSAWSLEFDSHHHTKPGMLAHTYNSNTWEVEAGWSKIPNHSWLFTELRTKSKNIFQLYRHVYDICVYIYAYVAHKEFTFRRTYG